LATHKAILEAHGIKNLAALGTLSFKAIIVPHPGLVRAAFVRKGPISDFIDVSDLSSAKPSQFPRTVPRAVGVRGSFADQPVDISKGGPPPSRVLAAENFTTAEVQVEAARRFVAPATRLGAPTSDLVSGIAMRMVGEVLVGSQEVSFPAAAAAAAASATSIPINTAYWVANTIALAADTTIVIQSDIRYLVIIANSIAIGTNVTLTYDEVPVANPPGVPAKPPAPSSTPVTPDSFSNGYVGYEGSPGTQPMQIGTPPNAPEVELWTLALNSLPSVNLKGQKGYMGVRGGDGANGGRGGNGSESVPGTLQCKSGPGNGGQGGKGGRGGTGGAGGNAGLGGRWALYTTSPVILALPGFLIDVSGGEGGDGGAAGAPGNGGPGGSRGGIHGFCANQNWSSRTDGAAGPSGDAGNAGPKGAPGTAVGPDAVKFVVIDQTEFWNKLTDPAITTVNPPIATVGATITISGFRFTPTDVLKIGGVATAFTYIADTMLQCAVPNSIGGLSHVQVTRSGGSQGSNYGTLWIVPVIVSTIPASPANRLRPGATIRILGTGFSPQTTVRVNGTQIAQATFINTQTIDFVMKRPNSVPYNPANAAGEPALLSIASSGPILASNSLPIVISTYQMLVMGDSIAWGEGLQDQTKFHTLVGAHVTAANANMSVYKTITAHTGAILGWNDTGSGPTLDGDIPESYPTVKQQAQGVAGSPNAATVDLILVAATANDVGFQHFLDPNATHPQILTRVTQYCHVEMRSFLIWLVAAFPAAKIIVTGYYAGVSLDSSPAYLVDLVGVMYGLENNQGLAPTALAIAKGVSPAGLPIIASNATFFATQANIALKNAVQEANLTYLPPQRIYFADPGFGPQNAALASNAWVFGLSTTLNILQPTDSPASAWRRKSQCQAVFGSNFTDRTFCELASAGHPNVTGAQHYAAAIISLL
jgi:hypothetical protein